MLGLDDNDRKSLFFDPNATFGSIEGINGASFSINKASIVELQEEIEELKKQTKSMFDEKTKLANHLNLSEDGNVQLTTQNQELQNRLKSLKASLDNALKYHQEIDELKTLAKSKEEELTMIEQNRIKNTSRIEEITNENMELQSRLDETMEQLSNALSDLHLAKKSHSVAIENLKEDNQEMKSKLNESMAVKVELESRIEELKNDMTNARESQFFQRTPSIFDMSESEFLSPSFDEEGLTKKIEEKVQEGEEEGPAANSTPFLKRLSRCNGVRGSISDEIKVLGVREMTPFCEKSALHNDSNSVVAKHVETVECATQTALFDRWNEPETDLQKPDQILSNIAAMIFLAMMTFFFFFGAIELEDGRMLMPMFWKLTSNWLSEPYAFLSITHDPPMVW